MQSVSGIPGSCPLLTLLPAFECYIDVTVNLYMFSFKNLVRLFDSKPYNDDSLGFLAEEKTNPTFLLLAYS